MDNKDKESQQPPSSTLAANDDQDIIVRNRHSTGAAPVLPSKQGSLSPEETDELMKKGAKICQSEPLRVEDGPLPHQFQSAWDKLNPASDKQMQNESVLKAAEVCS